MRVKSTPGLKREDYLVFHRGSERFAVARGNLQQIVRVEKVITLPGAKAYCLGALLWNNRLLPLVEPAAMLNFYSDESRVPEIGFVVTAPSGQFWVWAADTMLNLKRDEMFQYVDVELAENWMSEKDTEYPHLLYLNGVTSH